MSSIAPSIRQYASAFDGTPRPFPTELFDSLFAPTFHITKEEFNPGFEMKLENKYMYTTIDRDQGEVMRYKNISWQHDMYI